MKRYEITGSQAMIRCPERGGSALASLHLGQCIWLQSWCGGGGGGEVEQAYENNTLLELYTPLQSEVNPNIQASNEVMSSKISTHILPSF